jgi:hypothetical protein
MWPCPAFVHVTFTEKCPERSSKKEIVIDDASYNWPLKNNGRKKDLLFIVKEERKAKAEFYELTVKYIKTCWIA